MAGKIGVTFKDSKELPIHRWYPYVEGFSATWIQEMLNEFCKKDMNVYDPFGGSGTMNVEASKMGMKSYFSEMNPFMRFILNSKVNIVKSIQNDKDFYLNEMEQVKTYIESTAFEKDSLKDLLEEKYVFMLDKKYFEQEDLKQLRTIYEIADGSNLSEEVRELVKCAAACVTVDTSNMTRRADLRRRRSNEYLTRVVDVRKQFLEKWKQFAEDIKCVSTLYECANCISCDAREKNQNYLEMFDFVITSPPYINGTNYIRNTTLELVLTGKNVDEKDLRKLKEKTVCGGISDASSARLQDMIVFPFVEEVAEKLDVASKDKRIPLMVRCYFSDMYKVFESVYAMMKNGAKFALDIGDSKFYGVYVPTDEILCALAIMVGFKIVSQEKIAERFSRDKTMLKQILIIFEK